MFAGGGHVVERSGGAHPAASVALDVGLVEGNTQLCVGVPLGFGWWHPPAVLTASLSCKKTEKDSLNTNSLVKITSMN